MCVTANVGMQNGSRESLMPGGRKRPRSSEEDCDECMPISKRIHKLHIRSRQCSTDEDIHDGACGGETPINNNFSVGHGMCCSNGWDGQQAIVQNGTIPGQPNGHASPPTCPSNPHLSPPGGQQALLDGTLMANYDPELDNTQNPHYYRVNEMLYRAHVSRIQRQRQLFENS